MDHCLKSDIPSIAILAHAIIFTVMVHLTYKAYNFVFDAHESICERCYKPFCSRSKKRRNW